jgi:hypothetical protein
VLNTTCYAGYNTEHSPFPPRLSCHREASIHATKQVAKEPAWSPVQKFSTANFVLILVPYMAGGALQLLRLLFSCVLKLLESATRIIGRSLLQTNTQQINSSGIGNRIRSSVTDNWTQHWDSSIQFVFSQPFFPSVHASVIHLLLGLPSNRFQKGFPAKMLYAFLVCPFRATCPDQCKLGTWVGMGKITWSGSLVMSAKCALKWSAANIVYAIDNERYLEQNW